MGRSYVSRFQNSLDFLGGTSTRHAALASLADGADLVLVNEEVGMPFARETQHGVVEVFDPAADGLAIAELDVDGYLAIAERAEVESLLPCFAGRGCL